MIKVLPWIFLKMFETVCRFQKLSKKIRQAFFLSEIIALELIAVNSPYFEENLVIGSQCVNKQS